MITNEDLNRIKDALTNDGIEVENSGIGHNMADMDFVVDGKRLYVTITEKQIDSAMIDAIG